MIGFDHLKIIFIVQGEGRGHLTQSISLNEIIKARGGEVVSVIVGSSQNREIPQFFAQNFKFDIIKIKSPNFTTDKTYKSVRIIPSILHNLYQLPLFIKNLGIINEQIRIHNPDIIINFYEPLMGLYNMFYRNKVPVISIAHQFIYQHEFFKFPKSNYFDRLSLKLMTYIAGYKSIKKIAISFYELPQSKNKRLIICPPLLRNDILNTTIKEGDFILIYILNSGYAEEIIKWHTENRDVKIECFWDKKSVKEEVYIYHENLIFHKINDKKFVEKLSFCRGFMTTAGFESVCESVYLNKPVFMVPVENHFEQYCNSRDSMNIRAGLYDIQFDVTRFIKYLDCQTSPNKTFCAWVNSTKTILEKNIF